MQDMPVKGQREGGLGEGERLVQERAQSAEHSNTQLPSTNSRGTCRARLLGNNFLSDNSNVDQKARKGMLETILAVCPQMCLLLILACLLTGKLLLEWLAR